MDERSREIRTDATVKLTLNSTLSPEGSNANARVSRKRRLARNKTCRPCCRRTRENIGSHRSGECREKRCTRVSACPMERTRATTERGIQTFASIRSPTTLTTRHAKCQPYEDPGKKGPSRRGFVTALNCVLRLAGSDRWHSNAP